MASDQRGGRGARRRLLVLGVATVLVVAIPQLQAAAVQLLVDVMTLVALLGLLGVIALAIAWRVARRHPVADLLIGTWLLRRHERRRRRMMDARSWPKVQQPYDSPSWTPGTRSGPR